MIADRNTIKSWFQRGMKPLASQFSSLIDSFWHKNDTIPTASIEGLETTLNKKAEQTDVNNLYADFIIHRADDAKHKTTTEQDKLNNLAANPNATYATREELEQLSDNSMIIVPADFTKETAEMEAEIIATVQERLADGTLFQKPVFLLYKWKKDYTNEDAPVYYALVSKSDEKRTEGSIYPNIQMFFNSSIVVISADAAEYPAAYCIMLNIRGEQVRIAYQQYADPHPVYAISLTEDGNGIINSADKNWYSLYKELMKGNHPQVSLKTPDSGIYCPATYAFTSLDESLASPIYTGTMEISYVKEIEGRQELWVETRIFSDLSAATGTYNWENYLKKYSLTAAGGGELIEGDTKDCITTFPDQDTRTNIVSGEKHSILFGKIKRWFADLKAVAFTGRAADLSQDADNRLVTDAEKTGWADKYTRAEVDDKDAAGLQAAKEYAAQKIAEIVGSAPETLDTLNELAAALGNDPNFATSIMALIGGKADRDELNSRVNIDGSSVMTGALRINDNAAGNGLKVRLGKSYAGDAVLIALDDGNDGSSCYVGISPNKITYYNGTQESVIWHAGNFDPAEKADRTEIPTSLPANGGNADTVGGFGIDDLGKIINAVIADIDNMPGFFSGFWNAATSGTKPGDYGTVLQVANKYGSPNGGKEVWVFQIAHAHGVDRPMWRQQYNNGGWSSWKQLALANEVLGNTGDQVLNNGRFNMLVSASEHVIMFKDAADNIGYIGFGGYPAKSLQLMNYATGKFIEIAEDGKLYYDQKELAFKGDVGGETLMLDTNNTPEAQQRNIAVYKAAYTALSTYGEVPKIGLITPTDLGYSAGRRLWAIGAAQVDGVLKLTFCGLDSNDIIQYVKAMVDSSGVLVVTVVPH